MRASVRDRLRPANADAHTDADTHAATARYRFGNGQRNGDDELLEPWDR